MKKFKSFPWGRGEGKREGGRKRGKDGWKERGQTDHEHTKVKGILGPGNFLNKQRMVHVLWLLSRIFTETL